MAARCLCPNLVLAGVTSFGTKFTILKSYSMRVEILVGEIRPHYFAGYAGGAKTLFPGVAGAGIWR